MSLDFHRARLLAWLQTNDCFGSVRSYSYTMWLIKEWWDSYKHWESEDSFIRAFEQERLSVTQRPWVQKSVPGRDVNLLATPQNDQRGDKISHGTSLQFRTDVDSFRQRLDPASFRRTKGDQNQVRRMKYELGLHDMSASLLDPAKKTITEQLRWKPTAKGKGLEWAVIFMPLPR